MRELEIFSIFERPQDRACNVILLLQQHGRRQMARIGVDRVAEQQQLDQRDHDNHRKRDAVTLELDEFLDQHRPGAAPKAIGARPARFAHLHGHWKLSRDRTIRSMKTSSSDGSERFQWTAASWRKGTIAASSAAASRPDTCRLVPNGATMSTPGVFSSCWPNRAKVSRSVAVTS